MQERAVMDEKQQPGQPQGRLNRQAYESGQKARREGRSRDQCPTYQRRSLTSDWERGWDEAIVTPAAVVRVQETVVIERASPGPSAVYLRQTFRCPNGHERMPANMPGDKAVVLMQTFPKAGHWFAKLRCRLCPQPSSPWIVPISDEKTSL